MKALKLFTVTLFLAGAVAPLTTEAVEVRLGRDGDVNLRLDRDRREVKPRVSVDNNRVNVDVVSEPEPETEVDFSDGNLEIRRTRQPAESIGEFSIPFGSD